MDQKVNATERIVNALRAEGLSPEQILEVMIKGGFQLNRSEGKPEGEETPFEESKPLTQEDKLKDLLLELGMPRHLKGYRYTLRAVLLYNEDPNMALTRELYPMLAKEFETTPSRVERAIRHAIECTVDRCPMEVLQKFFGNTISFYKGKPTNSEFITLCVDWLNR